MANNLIPTEDNTSEILKADILKYGYINRRNSLRKTQTNTNASKRQEWAIKSLEEERNKLMTDLNVVIQSKSKIKENDRYKAKFVDLIYDTKHAEIELMEQRKLEKEVDREILQMEIQLNKPKTKTNKFILCDGPSLTINANNTYNKLIYEQNLLRIQVESLLKRWKLMQEVYNKLMNKLNKGRQLTSILSEQVSKAYIRRNHAKECLEFYLKISKTQADEDERQLIILKRQFNYDLEINKFLSQKLKRRENKRTQKLHEEDTEVLALNVEAENFIKHLVDMAKEKNLEKIMEKIVEMNLGHSSMFQFLVALETHLTLTEDAIERSRATVSYRTHALSEAFATKTAQLADAKRNLKVGRVSLREARRAARLMAVEWQAACRAADDLCDLLAMDAAVRPPTLLRRTADDDDADDADADADDDDVTDDTHDDHGRRLSADVADVATVADVAAYFGPVNRRLDDVLHRLFWLQENESSGGDGRRTPAAGDSMTTGSEQEDDFLARDLDDDRDRHAKIVSAVDQDAVPAHVVRSPDVAYVPSICPECLKKQFENIEFQGTMNYNDMKDKKDVDKKCQSHKISLKNVDDEEFKALFHKNSECPFYKPHKSQRT